MNPDLNFLLDEPWDVYHKKRRDYLSSHQLADFRNSPKLYHKKKVGLIADHDTPAFLLGRATHCYILEGKEVFKKNYAVGGPINPTTQKPYGSNTKAFKEWEEEQGKPVLTFDQMDLIEGMAESVHSHEEAAELLALGRPEGVVRAEYCGIDSQIRMDWCNPERGFVDLKTCDDLKWFESDARKYGYIHQCAFYRSILLEETNGLYPVYIIGVEKKEPFRAGVWRVGEEVLGQAQCENEKAIERLKECQEKGEWPTGYENLRTFDYI